MTNLDGPQLWRIDGVESSSGGGDAVGFYAVTDDPSSLPDAHKAYEAVRGPQGDCLMLIKSVKGVARVSSSGSFVICDLVADQTAGSEGEAISAGESDSLCRTARSR